MEYRIIKGSEWDVKVHNLKIWIFFFCGRFCTHVSSQGLLLSCILVMDLLQTPRCKNFVSRIIVKVPLFYSSLLPSFPYLHISLRTSVFETAAPSQLVSKPMEIPRGSQVRSIDMSSSQKGSGKRTQESKNNKTGARILEVSVFLEDYTSSSHALCSALIVLYTIFIITFL